MRPCPSDRELLAFHLGKLPESEVDAVAEHLEECPRCDAVVQKFDATDDPLLAALRHPPSKKSFFDRQTLLRPEGALGPDESEVRPELPGYEILDRLGRGGMGTVYRAVQRSLQRIVALKQLRVDNARHLSRSRAEAEVLARLHHPNIVEIHEIVAHEGRTYLALEMIDGGSLGAKISGKPQPPRETAALIETIARAVHHAHLHGIIHRDLKPSNILLSGRTSDVPTLEETPSFSSFCTLHGKFCIPKVADFGIAKHLDADSGATREGDVLGTPCYMAPEQAAGQIDRIGPATDVYSLGVILYEMLTGRVPLQGPTTIDTLMLVRHEEPVPPRRLQPRIPRDLETICLKCLKKEPAQRYGSAAELADDLRRFRADQPIQAKPARSWERAWKLAKRRPIEAVLSAALLVLATTALVLIVWQWRRAEAGWQLALDREEREKEARLQVQKLVGGTALSEGINLCERGAGGRGLLWMVRALELAESVGDASLARAARCNLAAWQPSLTLLQAHLLHGSWVFSVAFSPDGRTVATGSYDTTARLWDAASGQPRSKPLPHRFPVWSVAFSPDGKKLLTASGDANDAAGEGRLWDTESGQLLASWPHHGRAAAAVFSPNGRTCLTLTHEEAILRRGENGQPIGDPLKHPQPAGLLQSLPLTCGYRPDGKHFVTAGCDGRVRFWDASTGRPHGKPLDLSSPVLAVAFSPDGRTLLTGCRNGNVRMWDAVTGEPRSPVLPHRGQVRAVAFSPDGMIAATGGAIEEKKFLSGRKFIAGGEVQLWKIPTGESLGPPLPHPSTVWSLAFSPKGRRLLSGCEDGVARLFLTATGELMSWGQSYSGNIVQVAFSPDGRRILTADAGGGSPIAAALWRVDPEEHLPRLLLHDDTVTVLAFSPDSRLLLSGGEDHRAQLWDVATGQRKGAPLPHPYTINIAVFSPDSQSLFTSCEGQVQRDGQLIFDSHSAFWDVSTGRKRVGRLAPHRVFSAAFLNEGRSLLTGDIEGNLQFYDAADGKALGSPVKQPGSVFSLTVSPDGQTFLSGAKGRAILWDGNSRRRIKELLCGGQATAVHYFPDGKQALLVENGFAHVWDMTAALRKGPPLFYNEGGIRNLHFSPDGLSALTSDSDRVVRLWDMAAGKSIGPVLARRGIGPIALSPDGRYMIAGGKGGRMVLGETPQPLQGSVQQIRIRVEALTGMELDEQGTVHTLSPQAREERRRRLREGGAETAASMMDNGD